MEGTVNRMDAKEMTKEQQEEKRKQINAGLLEGEKLSAMWLRGLDFYKKQKSKDGVTALTLLGATRLLRQEVVGFLKAKGLTDEDIVKAEQGFDMMIERRPPTEVKR